jgi:hypothetical protein
MNIPQKSEKLEAAMDAIRAVLEDYNLGALVVIHTPGYVNYAVRIDPAYSCCRVENRKYVLKAKLMEDFGGNKAAMAQRLADTADMLNNLVNTSAQLALSLGNIRDVVSMSINASDPSVNN